jgi:SAM-dependent methyltransferase
MANESQFDGYAHDYESALAQGLAVSGEGRDYFAQGRIAFLRACLDEEGFAARQAMDFGCGTGESVPLIRDLVGAGRVVGVDESKESIDRAARTQAGAGIVFQVAKDYKPAADLDLVYTNGVFHHIPVPERPAAFSYIHDVLRPGGLFALWENNPWSLPARYVMSKIPFDRDAVMLSAREVGKLARAHGFQVVRTDYLFIFPAALRALRPLEQLVRRAPLGAQYQVLCARS